jgi:IS5 family transposase
VFRELFNQVVLVAKEKGLTDEKLKMIDATHLQANANRHKAYDKRDDNDKDGDMHNHSSDPDARVGYKGKDKPFYGYKSHQRIDTKRGIIEEVIVSPGNESDTPYFPALVETLLPGTAVTADQAYETENHEFLCKEKQLHPYMAIKSNRKDPFKERRKSEPKYIATLKLRSLFERTFGEAKQWHGLRKCRFRGLINTTIQCLMTAIVQNVKRIVASASGPPRIHPLYEQYYT